MRQTLTILVAEDDPNDELLLKLAFGHAGVNACLHFVSDGKEAIEYLQGRFPFNDRARHPWPDLLVLDLRMPGQSGFAVLEWLRQRPDSNRMGVVVLSGSQWQADIDRAYALGANFYFTKPLGFKELVGVAERLNEKCSSHPASAASVPALGLPNPVKPEIDRALTERNLRRLQP